MLQGHRAGVGSKGWRVRKSVLKSNYSSSVSQVSEPLGASVLFLVEEVEYLTG